VIGSIASALFDKGGISFGEQLYARSGHLSAAIAEYTRFKLGLTKPRGVENNNDHDTFLIDVHS